MLIKLKPRNASKLIESREPVQAKVKSYKKKQTKDGDDYFIWSLEILDERFKGEKAVAITAMSEDGLPFTQRFLECAGMNLNEEISLDSIVGTTLVGFLEKDTRKGGYVGLLPRFVPLEPSHVAN